jgi:predicted RNase H-like HicB family nuclease
MAHYTAIFEQAEDGTWGRYFPDCVVILVNGSTLSTHVRAFEVAA